MHTDVANVALHDTGCCVFCSSCAIIGVLAVGCLSAANALLVICLDTCDESWGMQKHVKREDTKCTSLMKVSCSSLANSKPLFDGGRLLSLSSFKSSSCMRGSRGETIMLAQCAAKACRCMLLHILQHPCSPMASLHGT